MFKVGDAAHPVVGADLQVVLQVLADAGRDGAASRRRAGCNRVAVADAGQLQELGRVHRAGRQHDFAARAGLEVLAVPGPGDADGAAVLDQHARDVDAGLQLEVGGRAPASESRAPRSSARPAFWFTWK